MSGYNYPENSFVNTVEYRLMYGTDGFLYAEHKVNGEIFVLINGEWEELDSVYEVMQSTHENNPNLDVDSSEFFPDDF